MPYVTVSQENSATIDLVKNQVKKLTDLPTMRWIFQMFQAVHLVTINLKFHDRSHNLKLKNLKSKISNLKFHHCRP
jgi:hypothetical protein